LITVRLSSESRDYIEENESQQGSIIDLLRKESNKSIGDGMRNLAEGRIRASPEEVRSLKAMEEMREDENYFMENTHS
jgi:hypothetical protein